MPRAKKTKGPGRPSLGEDTRSKTVQIAVTPRLKKLITELAAASAEKTTSNWGYTALLERLERERPNRKSSAGR